ncbi:MAG TPA: hypothetical protein DCG53_12685 [Syntrophus sp. (in: bacteria)]|jgi:SAM-dependent methyltransferase|nr:hypothetical protein [Syntrophus sp. (in: bacteria)]
MNRANPTPYDHILYPGHSYRQTHPDRLATLATLLGMQPAPVDRCRVLELGCGSGANLIPMAWGLPGTECVGIDLAARPVAEGQTTIQELGLGNIQLHQLDLLDFPDTMGTFDYIIAHGLYSWVPPAVRNKLMAVCQKHLAAHGVAFISYNTYPGCHIRDMLREMMLYHVHNAPDSITKIHQAQALLKFLADSQTEPDEYGRLLHKELERVMHYSAAHLFHDDLAEINQPLYFHQFMEHASSHGLQFLSEAEYFMVQTDQFPEHTVKVLNGLEGNILGQQQYLDFLRCRRFRQTLLCHADLAIHFQVRPEQMADFYFSAPTTAVSEASDISSPEEMEFHGDQGSRLKTTNPLAKAALQYLGSMWPQSVHFKEILTEALNSLGRARENEDEIELGAILQSGFGTGLVDVHLSPPRLVLEPGEYPMVSPVARMQAAMGDLFTTLRHRTVRLDDTLACQLVQMLDGTRTVASLTTQLRQRARDAESPGDGTGQGRTISAGQDGEREVKTLLRSLARLGLLVQ